MSMIEAPFRDYAPGTQPDNDSPHYRSTGLRHPTRPLLRIPQTITELSGPRFSPAQFPAIPNIALKA